MFDINTSIQSVCNKIILLISNNDINNLINSYSSLFSKEITLSLKNKNYLVSIKMTISFIKLYKNDFFDLDYTLTDCIDLICVQFDFFNVEEQKECLLLFDIISSLLNFIPDYKVSTNNSSNLDGISIELIEYEKELIHLESINVTLENESDENDQTPEEYFAKKLEKNELDSTSPKSDLKMNLMKMTKHLKNILPKN